MAVDLCKVRQANKVMAAVSSFQARYGQLPDTLAGWKIPSPARSTTKKQATAPILSGLEQSWANPQLMYPVRKNGIEQMTKHQEDLR